LDNLGEVSGEKTPGEIAAGDRQADDAHADSEAGPASSKELAEPTSRKFCAVKEEFVDGFSELRRFILQSGWPIQVDGESEICRRRRLSGPIGDEFLGVWIEVSFAERRRIDGVEQLLEFRDVDFDELTIRRKRIASRN
jgi:hypothetical protein